MRKKRKKIRDKYVFKNLFRTFILGILGLIILGAVLFLLIEKWHFLDAIYFVIMTITTIGYGDVVPATHAGKIISIIYALSGVPIFVGIVGLAFEERLKSSINKHMNELEKELIEAEEKLEKTENKLLKEKRELVKIKKEEIQEQKKKGIHILKKIFRP